MPACRHTFPDKNLLEIVMAASQGLRTLGKERGPTSQKHYPRVMATINSNPERFLKIFGKKEKHFSC